MGSILLVLQILTALGFVILMAVQTDKADAGGVMGLGGQGGRVGEEVDMAVGAERILKPLSKWLAVGFLFLSAMAAMNGEGRLPWWGVLVFVALFLFVMTLGNRLWASFTRSF